MEMQAKLKLWTMKEDLVRLLPLSMNKGKVTEQFVWLNSG